MAKGQGFSVMDPNRHQKLSSNAGKAVPAERRAFSKNPSLAKSAGRKGGAARKVQRGWRWCTEGGHLWHVKNATEYKPVDKDKATQETCAKHVRPVRR